jgi:hypothetical protein
MRRRRRRISTLYTPYNYAYTYLSTFADTAHMLSLHQGLGSACVRIASASASPSAYLYDEEEEEEEDLYFVSTI